MALRATCLLLCALLMAGCASSSSPTQPAPSASRDATRAPLASSRPLPASTTAAHSGDTISVALPNGLLSLDVPRGWQAFATEDGVVLAEHMGGLTSMSISGSGLLAYVFAPTITDTLPGGPSTDNPALEVLRYMRAQPHVMGHALVSEAQPFMWGMYPAAYYTLSNSTGDMTLLVAAAVNDTTLVVCNITLPHAQATRIDTLLPDVLARVQLGDALLAGADLGRMSRAVVFPVEGTPSTVASEATRATP